MTRLRFAAAIALVSCTACQIEILKTEAEEEPTTGGSTTSLGPTDSSSSTSGAGGGSGGQPSEFEGEWEPALPQLSDMSWNCGVVSFLTAHPRTDLLIAGIYSYGLWGSKDGGDDWEELGQGKDSEPIDHGASWVTYDPDDSDVFWESGIYGTKGIFKTVDGGETFEQLGDILHNDFVTVDFEDPDRKTLLASGHERQILYKSTDGGETWEDIGDRLPNDVRVCQYPLILDADTYLMGCGSIHGEGDRAILRSTDGGESWDHIHAGGENPPLVASDGSIYWTDNGALIQSTDKGKTWEARGGEGILPGLPLVEMSDERIAALSFAAVIAWDGDEWQTLSPELPYKPTAFAYSSQEAAFYVAYLICQSDPFTEIQSDAIMRYRIE